MSRKDDVYYYSRTLESPRKNVLVRELENVSWRGRSFASLLVKDASPANCGCSTITAIN